MALIKQLGGFMKANYILYIGVLFFSLWTGLPSYAAGNKPPRPEGKGKGRNGKPLGRGQSYHDLPPGSFVEHLVKRGQRNKAQRLGTEAETASGDVFKTPQPEEGILGKSRLGGFMLGGGKATGPTSTSGSPSQTKNLQSLKEGFTDLKDRLEELLNEGSLTGETFRNISFELLELIKEQSSLGTAIRENAKLKSLRGEISKLIENIIAPKNSRAILDHLGMFIQDKTSIKIPEKVQKHFLQALDKVPGIKRSLNPLLDKIPDPDEGHFNPAVKDTYILAKDTLAILHYTANSKSETKLNDLREMISLAGTRDSTDPPNILNVLFEVYRYPPSEILRAGVNIISLSSSHPRIRQKLSPEERALFENKKWETSLKEWKNLTQQIRNRKTEIEQIIEAFDKLHLSEETKTTLKAFMKGEVSPEATTTVKRLQQLADNIHNVSEKNLQTLIWYIESYMQYKTINNEMVWYEGRDMQYETIHNRNYPRNNRETVWEEDLNHLITLVSFRSDYHEFNVLMNAFMDALHTTYGAAAGNNISPTKGFPKIMDVYFESYKTKPEVPDFIADSLTGEVPRSSLFGENQLRQQKRETFIEVIKNYPEVRDILFKLAFYINFQIDISKPAYNYPSNFDMTYLLLKAKNHRSLFHYDRAQDLVDLVIGIESTTVFDSHPHMGEISQLVNLIKNGA